MEGMAVDVSKPQQLDKQDDDGGWARYLGGYAFVDCFCRAGMNGLFAMGVTYSTVYFGRRLLVPTHRIPKSAGMQMAFPMSMAIIALLAVWLPSLMKCRASLKSPSRRA